MKKAGRAEAARPVALHARPEEGAKWLGAAGHGETDGVVAKRLDGPYAPGERTMIKVKRLAHRRLRRRRVSL